MNLDGLYSASNILDPSCFSSLSSHEMSQKQPQNRDARPYRPFPRHAAPSPSTQERILLRAVGKPPSMPHGAVSYPTAGQFFEQPIPFFRQPIPVLPHPQLSVLKPTASPSSSIVTRMSSAQIPNIPLTSPQVEDCVARDLEGNVFSTSFDFTSLLFPGARLPFPVDVRLFHHLSKPHSYGEGKKPLWDLKNSMFLNIPTKPTEVEVCNWMNAIGEAMGGLYQQEPKRLWWAGNRNIAVAGSHVQRKPDLILVERLDYHHISNPPYVHTDWTHVHAFAEATSQSKSTRIDKTINVKTYLMFRCCPTRRFVIALSFTRKEHRLQFGLTITDHEGQIRWAAQDILGPGSFVGTRILTILTFLFFRSRSDLGLDPYVKINARGDPTMITVDGQEFQVVEPIYSLDSFLGRGTHVWLVTKDGNRYIIKDSWIQEDRVTSEVVFLQKMAAHPEIHGCVPELICGGDVVINGLKDSTSVYRGGVIGKPRSSRLHRRIVISPVGEPLLTIHSPHEFLQVLISLIRSMSSAYIW